MEKGGALYIEYTGNNPNEIYAVRIIGGSQYPVLDVTRAETAEERKELTDAYVAENGGIRPEDRGDALMRTLTVRTLTAPFPVWTMTKETVF